MQMKEDGDDRRKMTSIFFILKKNDFDREKWDKKKLVKRKIK